MFDDPVSAVLRGGFCQAAFYGTGDLLSAEGCACSFSKYKLIRDMRRVEYRVRELEEAIIKYLERRLGQD